MARRRKPRQFINQVDESMNLNDLTYDFYFNYLYGLTVNSILWDGLPDTVSQRFLEVTLTEKGYGVWFEDEILAEEYGEGILFLPCTYGAKLDIYNIPIDRRAYATNGYQRQLSKKDSVIMFNNYQHTPDLWVIDMYARKLTYMDRAIDVNINNQKFPYIILASQQDKLSLENFYMQLDGNTPAIWVKKNFDLDAIKQIPTLTPFIADKGELVKHQIMNDFLTWLGAENSNQDKKERLVSNEVGSNYGNVELSRNVRLSARLEAAKEVNEMFGYDIQPRFNSDLATMLNLGQDGGDINEQIYDPSKMDSGNEIEPGNPADGKQN